MERAHLDTIMSTLKLPASLKENIEADFLYGSSHGLPEGPEEATLARRETWILKAISRYNESGKELLYEYQEDFTGWNQRHFESCNILIQRALKSHLETNGVTLLGRANGKRSERLARALELEYEDLPTPKGTSNLVPTPSERNTETTILRITEQPTSVTPKNEQQDEPDQDTKTGAIETTPFVSQGLRGSSEFTPKQNSDENKVSGIPRADIRGFTVNPNSMENELEQHRMISIYDYLPPLQVPNKRVEPHMVKALSSAWNKANDYSGEPYDIFDDKVREFMTICEMLQIELSQVHALFPQILTKSARTFFITNMRTHMTFKEMYMKLKERFEDTYTRQIYYRDWSSISFRSVKAELDQQGKRDSEVLAVMLEKLQKCQRALGPKFAHEEHLIAATLRAIESVRELKTVVANPAITFTELSNQITTTMKLEERYAAHNTFFVDRRYEPYKGKGDRSKDRYPRRMNDNRGWRAPTNKGCYTCGKPGCRPSNHTEEERQRFRERRIRDRQKKREDKRGNNQFMATGENEKSTEEQSDDLNRVTSGEEAEEEDSEDGYISAYFMNNETAEFLADESFQHRLEQAQKRFQTTNEQKKEDPHQTLHQRDVDEIWHGIIPDTGAATISTAGIGQVRALQRRKPDILIDKANPNKATVRFGAGKGITVVGKITLDTQIGEITFHVVPTSAPFLLCIQDMDKLGVYLNNTSNELVKANGTRVPILCKWGHPWFYLPGTEPKEPATYLTRNANIAMTFLTEKELRTVHRRFGHPSVERLWKTLQRAGHEVNRDALELINRFCHHCQIKGSAPQRFKFTLKDDIDFNYEGACTRLEPLGSNAPAPRLGDPTC